MSVRVSGSVSLSVRTGLTFQWVEVAVRQEADAHRARARGEVTNDELQASMVCMAASAFALDAMYGELRQCVPDAERRTWQANGLARWRQVYEALRRAFALSPHLRDEMRWLFDRDGLGRDFLVHPDAEFRDAADHPLLPNTTAERATYRAENATRSMDIVMGVLDASLHAQTPLGSEWQRQYRGRIEQLCSLREELSGA